MRLLTFGAAITALAVSSATAQPARTAKPAQRAGSAYLGHDWTGLLVSAACEAKSETGAEHEAAMTTSGRTTTPAVDESGTRGQAGAMGRADRAHTRNDSPRLGDVLNDSTKSADLEWARAHRQAKSLPAACRITPEVQVFALILPNGRMLPFNDAANVTIVKRLSGGLTKPAIIRVHVAGKLQDGKIALDTLEL
jgi:hypothetical protein